MYGSVCPMMITQDSDVAKLPDDAPEDSKWQRHLSIVKVVCQTYYVMKNSSQLWIAYSKFFIEMMKVSLLSMTTAYGLLKGVTCWLRLAAEKRLEVVEITPLCHLVLASLLWTCENRHSGIDTVSQNMSQDLVVASTELLSVDSSVLKKVLEHLEQAIQCKRCHLLESTVYILLPFNNGLPVHMQFNIVNSTAIKIARLSFMTV
jgi:hypothetical protein